MMSRVQVAELVEQAWETLSKSSHTLTEAATVVPDRAGLYAIFGSVVAWQELGLGAPPADRRPLYIGKAEASLVTRDLNTHFRVGCTGQSTVRRTFSALLREKLSLRGIPRNQKAPERPANFALSEAHDEALNLWMHAELRLAVWAKPDDTEPPIDLGAIEVGVITRCTPPLNVRDNDSAWRAKVSAARKVMADDARAWAAERGLSMKARS